MRSRELKRLVDQLPRMSTAQRSELTKALQAVGCADEVSKMVESRMGATPSCPHCQSSRVVRNGHASGLQRFKCAECAKTFNALTSTPLARLRMKGKWIGQQEALQEGLSVHKAAAKLKVSPSTAFRWRHRFLKLAQPVQAPELTGVVEADETFFRRSYKGQAPPLGRIARKRGGPIPKADRGHELVPVLVARDRSAATADFVLAADTKTCIVQALQLLVQADAILCTDSSLAMAAAAHQLELEHQAVNLAAGVRVRGPWHIQNVNNYHSRLKGWLHRFRGVATSYLSSYLGWFRALDRSSKNARNAAPMLELALGISAVTT